MKLRAPLSFICTFIFGQLFDRKRRFEDSFVLFGENREDASGNVMQQPFDTPWCPPPAGGSWRAGEQLARCFGAGHGARRVRARVSPAWPPPWNGPSAGVALRVGLNNPEAALLRVGG